MANADSNTITCPEFEPAIIPLLKKPLGASMDLFQVLDGCQLYVEALIENYSNVECMALCGRLLAGLEVLRSSMNAPLPEHLIERLILKQDDSNEYRCPLSTDSETLREYCSALTMLLLNQEQSEEQRGHITGILYEMVNVLVEDLKAPRFVRTDAGLIMISGEKVPCMH
jgi:hypothetical protein